ncbi:hypothetical protein NC653_027194 [Populus alba x Populus x berolinensis]|uniref:SNF2 N-terminal domain-containing protein n=1 Tax=Populus alba x Populus x berolinensis TaxID=444605 RepID=A0AAD6Q6I0_9ROSI|nr:hypothetical protein NC653_027194 [Populus alba x Populus x berolinensis]
MQSFSHRGWERQYQPLLLYSRKELLLIERMMWLLRMKKGADGSQVTSNHSSTKSLNSSRQSKGRPATGTLIVCPTSVLRQWDDELHKKVTTKANLSVLVYHGSNRTKDGR